MSVAITGGPNTGKTTLSKELADQDEYMDHHVLSTDDTMWMDWPDASQAVSTWFDNPKLIVEGVAVPRALRKWLKANPTGKPVEKLIYLAEPHQVVTSGQAAMSKGIRTVLDEIRPELEDRGVTIVGL